MFFDHTRDRLFRSPLAKLNELLGGNRRSRRAARRMGGGRRQPSPAARKLLFEALEQRLLLSADLNPLATTALSSQPQILQYAQIGQPAPQVDVGSQTNAAHLDRYVSVADDPIFNVTTDWSNSANPNGQWSVNSVDPLNPPQLLGPLPSTTRSDPWGTPQNSFGDVPGIFQSNGDEQFAHNWQTGDIVAHSSDTQPIALVWTASEDDIITVNGSAWQGTTGGADTHYSLFVNGTKLFEHSDLGTDRDNRDAFSYSNGFAVHKGDDVEFLISSPDPGGDYLGLDLTVSATPVATEMPIFPGSGIFTEQMGGTVAAAGQTVDRTISLEAGQSLGVGFSPGSSDFTGNIQVLDPSDNIVYSFDTTPYPGTGLGFGGAITGQSGDYTFRVTGTGATTGDFSWQVWLNAVVEDDGAGDNSNDTMANAVDLEWTSHQLQDGGDRMAALGRVSDTSGTPDVDMFSFQGLANQTVSINLAFTQPPSGAAPTVTVLDSNGNPVAAGLYQTSQVQQGIVDLVLPSDGTYYVQVSGNADTHYALLVTRDVGFNVEDLSNAPLSLTGAMLGSLGRTDDGYISVGVHGPYWNGDGAAGVVNQLYDGLSGFQFSANAVEGSYLDDVNVLNQFDTFVLGDSTDSFDLQGLMPSLLSYVEGGGGLVMTGWALQNASGLTGESATDFAALSPVDTTSFTDVPNLFVTPDANVDNPIVDGVGPFVASNAEIAAAIPDATVLARSADGSPVVVSRQVGLGRVIYLAPAYAGASDSSLTNGSADLLLQQSIAAAARRTDTYTFQANAGDQLDIHTVTPFDGPEAPANSLDPMLTLYDPNGNVVASDADGWDGRNAWVSYQAVDGGTYTVAVMRQAGVGDYVLHVDGATASPSDTDFYVSSADPTWLLNSAPQTFTVGFSRGVLLSNLTTDDITITPPGGGPDVHPAGWSIVDGRTIAFDISNITGGDGDYAVNIAAGAFTSIDGTPVDALSTGYSLDTTPPQVTSATVTDGAVLPTGTDITFQASFTENLASYGYYGAAVVDPQSGSIIEYAKNFAYDSNTFTSTYTFAALPEGAYELHLFTNQNYDAAGNSLDGNGDGVGGPDSSDDYVVHFSVDPAAPIPLTFAPTIPGSLAYQASATGYFSDGDVDAFTTSIDPGQTLSLALEPDSGVTAQLTLLDHDGNVVASFSGANPGDPVLLEQVPVAGDYTVQVASIGGVGSYQLTATLNSRIEAETVSGADDSIGTAQSIDDTSVAVGAAADRLAVVGRVGEAADNDYYSFSLDAGQRASIAVAGPDGAVRLALFDSSGNLITLGIPNASNSIEGITDFVATQAGTYYVRVTGDAAASNAQRYSLVVTRDAEFEPILMQPVGDGALMGSTIGQSSTTYGQGQIKVAILGSPVDLLNQLNDDTYFNFSAQWVSASQIDTVAELDAFNVVVLGDYQNLNAYRQIAPALKQWVESGRGGVVATGWTVYAAGAGNGTVADLEEILPVNLNGSYNYFYSPTVVIEDPSHPMVAGLPSSFVIPEYVEFSNAGINPGADVIAAVNGTPVVVAGHPGEGRSVYLGPVYAGYSSNNLQDANSDRLIEQAVAWAAAAGDTYSVTLAAGQTFTVSTATPGDGPASPDNTFDPALTLIDSDGNVVAQADNEAADGRNAILNFTPGTDGTYRLIVGGSGAGDYVLQISGTATTAAPFTVTQTEPPAGGVLGAANPVYTMHLSEGVLADSIDPSDLTVNGIAASNVQLIDGNILAFTIDTALAGDGNYDVEMAAGALTDLEGDGIAAFSSSFILDATPPSVVSVTPDTGTDASAPVSEVDFNFSEAIKAASVNTSDITSFTDQFGNDLRYLISGVSVVGAQVQVFFGQLSAEGDYTMTLGPGVEDLAGNPMAAAFTTDFNVLTADLTVSDVTVVDPAPASGESTSVTWIDHNIGDAPTTRSYYDRVWFSTNDVLDGGDIDLGDFYQGDTIDIGASATRTGSVTLPGGHLDGTYHIIVQTDVYNYQPETDENNNFASTAFNLTNADLTASNFVAPDQASTNQGISVQFTVTNSGTGTAAQDWYDGVYISTDATLSSNDTLITTWWAGNNSPLAPGASYVSSGTVTVPTGYADGTYYLIAKADVYDYQNESNNNNNWVARQITVGSADLTASDVVAPDSAAAGQTVTVNFTVTNSGTGTAAQGWYDAVYLSTDATYSGDDQLLTYWWEGSQAPLDQNESYVSGGSVPLPGGNAEGTYYLIAVADAFNYQYESNENNNWAAKQITVANADLTASDLTSPDNINAGDNVGVGFTVTNSGAGTASQGWYDAVYLSTDATLSADDTRLNYWWEGDKSPLVPGASYTSNGSFTVPGGFADGTYYLIGKADAFDSQGESNNDNNWVAKQVTLSNPDLTTSNVTLTDPYIAVSGNSAYIFETAQVTWTEAEARAVAMGGHLVSINDANEETFLQQQFDQYGDYWIGLNDAANEGTFVWDNGDAVSYTNWTPGQPDNAGNAEDYVSGNWSSGRWNDYPPSARLNFIVEMDTAQLPAFELASGQVAHVQWTVTNNGTGSADDDWYDRVWLSSDNVLDASDTYLNEVWEGPQSPLAPGASYTQGINVTVPAGFASGNYYVLVETDHYSQQPESNEGNNVASTPFALTNSDLTVQGVTAPAGAASGQTITVQWTGQNLGDGVATTDWADYVYLSTATTLGVGSDYYLGQLGASDVSPLYPNGTYSGSLSVQLPGGLADGNYYIIVKADGSGSQPESNDTNNTASAAISLSNADLKIDSFAASDATTAVLGGSAYMLITAPVSWTDAEARAASMGGHLVTIDSADEDAFLRSRFGSFGDYWIGLNDAASEGTFVWDDGSPSAYRNWYANQPDNSGNEDYVSGNYGGSGWNDYPASARLNFIVEMPAANLPAWQPSGGSSTRVEWTVSNDGTGVAATDWYDRVWFSTDNVLDGNDTYLGEVSAAAQSPLAVGANYTLSSLVTLPGDRADGNYYLILQTDHYNQQPEGNETNNTSVVPISLTNADLTVSNITAPDVVASGQQINVQWVGHNSGTGTATADWSDYVYFSTDATLDGSDTYLGSTSNADLSPLAAGSDYAHALSLNVTIPSGHTDGTYYLIVVADGSNSQAESNNGNNALVHAISLSNANLAIDSVTAPASASTGETVNVSWVTKDIGTGNATTSWYDSVWISPDATLGNGNDVLLRDVSAASTLLAGGSYQQSTTITVPGTLADGTYYLIFQADRGNNQPESNEGDNLKTSAITISNADLVVTDITAPDAAAGGQTVNVQWTGKNQGAGTAFSSYWYDEVYLSTDATFDAGDTYLAGIWTGDVTPVAPGATYTRSVNVTLPGGRPDGNYYLIVKADVDNYQPESNETNNTLAKAITLGNSDLVVTGMTAPDAVASGQTVNVQWTGKNQGTGTAATDWYDQVFLSTDAVLDAGDTALNYISAGDVSPLAPNGTYNRSLNVTIPTGRPDGTYYLIVKADAFGNQPESDESNNTFAKAITLGNADLVVTSVTAPLSAASGQSISVQWSAANQGTGNTITTWADYIYLSTDTVLDAGDVFIGSAGSNGTYPLSANVTVPSNQAAGTYYVLVKADGGNNQPESNESNNVGASAAITIGSPDLRVDQFIAPANSTFGSTIPIQWTASNDGTRATAANWYDAVYLSTDNTLSGDDQLLYYALANANPLSPTSPNNSYLDSTNLKLPLQQSAVPGTYYLIAVTDAFNNIVEANAEGNNTRSSAITLSWPALPDLQVSDITVTPNLHSGDTMQIGWNVDNNGDGPTANSFYDRVTVRNTTTGQTLYDNSVYYDATQNGAIAAGGQRAQQVQFKLPDGDAGAGSLEVTVTADYYSQVFERNGGGTAAAEANNTTTATTTSALADYADLVVDSLAIGPISPQSGDTLSITWKDRNDGTAAAGTFYDRVQVINQTTGETLADTALLHDGGSPIAGGASQDRQFSLKLPDGVRGVGNLLVRVTTDNYGQVFEHNAGGTAETNNTAQTTIASALAPYPDLIISSIVAPGDATAGSSFDISWTVTNQGTKSVTSDMSETVYLSSDAAIGGDQSLGSFFFAGVTIGAGQSVTHTGHVTLPAFGDGNRWIVVSADAGNAVFELNETNNTAIDDQPILLDPGLLLSLGASQLAETAGAAAAVGSVTRSGDTSQDLTVTLTSGSADVIVPSQVVIPAGKSAVTFNVGVTDNNLVDGNRTINVTASGSGYVNGSAALTITDNDVPTLALDVAQRLLTEGDGSVMATLTRNTPTDQPLTVSLSMDKDGKITIPDTVTIDAGQTTATFSVGIVDDNFAEGPRDVRVAANASGFVTGSVEMVINDNDVPTLSLKLSQQSISEGAGFSNPTYLTITRSFVTDQPLDVDLRGSPDLLRLPSGATIEGGQASVTVAVMVYNDDVVNGSRVVPLEASVADGVLGTTIPGTAVDVPLEILDDDGPTLVLSIDNPIVAEVAGPNAATGTVTRTSGFDQDLVVALASSDTSEATVPTSVTILAGQTSATFAVAAVNDGVTDGTQNLTLVASAAGYNPGAVGMAVTDQVLSDLKVSSITVPATAETGSTQTVSWTVKNIGAGSANGSWVDRVYLSNDVLFSSDDVLVGQVANPTALDIGQSYTSVMNFTAPDGTGNLYIIVVTDAQTALNELSKTNNIRVTDPPVDVTPSYRATVSADVDVAPAGTPIDLHGHAYVVDNNSPAMFEPVQIQITTGAVTRTITTYADDNGDFTARFTPLPGETGHYTIRADYPGVKGDPQDSFVLVGMKANQTSITAQMLPNDTLTGDIELDNLTDVALTNLQASLAFTPPGVTIDLTVPDTLAGSGVVHLGYTIHAANDAIGTGLLPIKITTAEGVQLSIPINLSVIPLHATLVTNPGFLTAGMYPGDTPTYVTFDISNTGGAASGPLQILLPTNLPWLSLASDSTIASIDPGQKTTVTLRLAPDASVALQRYDGSIVVQGANVSTQIAFQFRALSEKFDDVKVTVEDEATYTVEGSPLLAGARVTLADPYTGETVATGISDATGIVFSHIAAGTYLLTASADRHETVQMSLTVDPGNDAANTQAVFLHYQAVTYNWTVVPTEIQDHYKIVLEADFSTEVPMPVVTVDTLVIPLVLPGQTTTFNLTYTNHGLIDAEHVQIRVPTDDPDFIITPLINEIPILAAGATVIVPVTISARSDSLMAAAAIAGAEAGVISEDAGTIPLSTQLPTAVPDGWGGTIAKCLGIDTVYTYECKNGQWVSLSTSLKPVMCAEDIKGAAKSILEDIAEHSGGNLVNAGCDVLGAILTCLKPDLNDCVQALISSACKGIGGFATGGPAGAVAGLGGALSDIVACLCWLASLLPAPSGGSGTGDGGGGGWGGFGGYGGGLYPYSTPIGFSLPAICGGSTSSADADGAVVTQSTNGVCAEVHLRIEQQAVITRTAFVGTLDIGNGLDDTSLQDVQMSIDIQDTEGHSANDMFVIHGPDHSGFTADGSKWTLGPSSDGKLTFTFIPTVDAAPDAPVQYLIGGTLTYFQNGEKVTVKVVPAEVTVNPEAKLQLNYFWQRDVFGDDPFTPQIEPSEPFALGLEVLNIGHGTAKDMTITSAQPEIVENEKGLLINFKIISSQVGNQSSTQSLTVDLGTIAPGQLVTAQWDLLSSLQGKFKNFTASFEHEDDDGDLRTSLIDSVQIHELTRSVEVSTPTDDGIPDYLVNDVPDPDNLPDVLYLSTGGQAPVSIAQDASITAINGSQMHLTATMASGWSYLTVPDPEPGMELVSVKRSDGTLLSIDNTVWRTDRTFLASETGARTENNIHLLDYNSTGDYTLTYRVIDNTPPTITDIQQFPGVQINPVGSVDVTFSEPIDPTTFSTADVSLKYNGAAVDLSAATITQLTPSVYRIGGLDALTGADGNYSLTVNGPGINDLGDNPATNSATTQWAMGANSVVITDLQSVQPPMRNTAVSTLDVTFSDAIDASTFTFADLGLTRDGVDVTLDSNVNITAISATQLRIGGLSAFTTPEGHYELTVRGSDIADLASNAVSGLVSADWTMDTTAPTLTSIEQLTEPVRNTIVPSLDVTFSEPIDPTTFDYHDLTLTWNGGATNLITDHTVIERIDDTTYRIENFNDTFDLNLIGGIEGLYKLTVDASGITDVAGNAGTNSETESWVIDLTKPGGATNLHITPDDGVSNTDGLTDSKTITLAGTLPETGDAERLTDMTTNKELGYATVTDTSFAGTFTLSSGGTHHLRARTVDGAGNLSDAFFDVFVDLTPPTVTSLSAVSPSLRTSPVDSVDVTLSEAIDPNSFTWQDVQLTRDGAVVDLSDAVTITQLNDTSFRIGGLTAFTGDLGAYTLTILGSTISDRAGNAGTGSQADAWSVVDVLPTGFGGHIWNDYNGDGKFDIGPSVPAWQTQEAGMSGWTVFLDTNSDGQLESGEESVLTGADGSYQFTDLAPGTYHVVAESRGGWISTAPAATTFDITVAADEYKSASFDFGRFQLGEIHGVKFDDLNGDGNREAGEDGLAGWTIYLDLNANGILDINEPSVVTGADGSYSFTNLGPGSLRVGEVQQNGWTRTTPTPLLAITTDFSLDEDIGNVQTVTLSGSKFNDLNGNGVWDAGEVGIQGWTIFLDANGDGIMQSNEQSTQTDADGHYTFTGLLPGSYIVGEVQRDGWVQTTPLDASVNRAVTTAGSDIEVSPEGCSCGVTWSTPEDGVNLGALAMQMADSLTGLTPARDDSRFANLYGSGTTTVVIDTGIDVDNSFFGADANHDGIADRIIYQYDFADNDADASDVIGHGSHVSTIIASDDQTYPGVAPDTNLIVLKVFDKNGHGYFSYIEKALQWVIANADTYNIDVVNMSLGDNGNWTNDLPRYGIGDELATLAAKNIIMVAAAGNDYSQYNSMGVAYPAADPAVLAVGSVWVGDFGGPWRVSTGAVDYTTGADRIAAYSQRDEDMIDTFAPGSRFNGADANGGIQTMQGTSQAAAFVSGAAALSQELAKEVLGHYLSTGDFAKLLRETGDLITDGDDENDNVQNTGLQYPRIDFVKLFNAIESFQSSSDGSGDGGGTTNSPQPVLPQNAAPGVHAITATAGQTLTALDFGNFQLGSISGTIYEDLAGNGLVDAGDVGIAGREVWLDDNNNGVIDGSERTATTDANGHYSFSDLGPGSYHVRDVVPAGWNETGANPVIISMSSGLAGNANFFNKTAPTNTAPVADAGGPYLIQHGQGVTLSGAGSFDPDAGDSIVSYAWDIDGDGQYDDASGVSPTLSAAQLATLGLTGGSYTIGLQVTDAFGATSTDTATLRVNKAPNAAFTATPNPAAPTDIVHFDGSTSSDPDVGDSIISYAWDLDNDGQYDDATGATVDHSFGHFGSFVVGLQVTDSTGATATTSHTVVVNQGDRAPIAEANGPYTVQQGKGVTLSAAGSSDPDNAYGDSIISYAWDLDHDGQYDDATGASPTLTASQLSALGLANGVFTIGVQVTDTFGVSGTDTASLTVLPTNGNHAPVATADSVTTKSNAAISIKVLANDKDPDAGAVLSVDPTSLPATSTHGAALKLNADGSVTYDPTASDSLRGLTLGQLIADTFTYRIKDQFGAVSGTATVSLRVSGQNRAPTAVADTVTGDEDVSQAIAVMANDSDPDGDAISLTTVPATSTLGAVLTKNADGTITYDPTAAANLQKLNEGDHATDSFVYTVSDPYGHTAQATVTITVAGHNDAPVGTADTAATTSKQAVAINVLGNDKDADTGAVLNIDLASFPAFSAHGAALSINANGTVQFDPNASAQLQGLAPGATQTDTFTYRVRDQFGALSAPITVTITVTGATPIAAQSDAAPDTPQFAAFASAAAPGADTADNADAIDTGARLRRLRGDVDRDSAPICIDLAATFVDFDLGSVGESTATPWQADFISQFDPAKMAAINQTLRLAVPLAFKSQIE